LAEQKHKERTRLRSNLESIAIAVLLVLCVRQTVVEAFRIRHGSMAPTLVGDHFEIRCPNCGWSFDVGKGGPGSDGEVECSNCHFRWDATARYDSHGAPLRLPRPEWLWNSARGAGGERITGPQAANKVIRGPARIFVNKFIYRLRKPRRWEVIVFLYPRYYAQCKSCGWTGTVNSPNDALCPECGSSDLTLEAKNFIKRIAGLPGEEVRLRGGDVYINGQIARKPSRVQESLWMHVYDSRFLPRHENVKAWRFSGGRATWSEPESDGSLTLDALDSEFPEMARFGQSVRDSYAYNGGRSGFIPVALDESGAHDVGDCRIRARVRPAAWKKGGRIILELRDAGHVLTAAFSPTGRVALNDNGAEVRDGTAARLPPDRAEWISLENYDDRAVVKVGGRELLRYDYTPRNGDEKAISFGAREAKVQWERVIIERDIYYADVRHGLASNGAYRLGPHEYFVLGDNNPASSDSRRWTHPGIPARNIIGRAIFVFWPVHKMKWLPAGAPPMG